MFSSKSMTPIDRQLSKKVVKIIHALLMMEQSAAFRKPVPHKALGLQDYKLIVKKPTDLNLIRRQNNEGKYKFAEQILDQIQLCWDNCKIYNAIGSDIYDQALYMEKAFDKFGLQILPDFWKDIDREDYNQKFQVKKIEQEKMKKPEQKGNSNKKVQRPLLQQEYPSEEILRQKPKKVQGSNSRLYEQQEQIQQEIPDMVVKKDGQIEEAMDVQIQEGNAAEGNNIDKDSNQNEGEDGQDVAVQPIMVKLSESPTRQQLTELTNIVKGLYDGEDYGLLEKVLQILHSNEKENMTLNKNGLMTFKMHRIHISTYHRIRKLVGQTEEIITLIQ